LAAKWGRLERRIVYAYTAPGVAAGSTATLLWKPADGWRWDVTPAGQGTLTWVQQGSSLYVCLDEECYHRPTRPRSALFSVTYFAESAPLFAEVPELTWERSERAFLGRPAACFRILGVFGPDGPGEETSVCFDDEGALVFHELPGYGSAVETLTATSVEAGVSDADLELPYPVTDPFP
jgi:hypothetical protein